MASSRDAFKKTQDLKSDTAPIVKATDTVNKGPTNRTFNKILENVYKPGFIDTKDPETMKMSIDRELGELSKALFKTSERDAHNIRIVEKVVLETGGLKTSIEDVKRLSTEGDVALAQQIHTLESSFGDVDGKIAAAVQVEETARTSADTALGQRIVTVQSHLDDANAKITSETTARTTADTALGQRIDTVHAEIGTATGTITQEMTVKITAVDTKATDAGTAAAAAHTAANAAQASATAANTAATTAHTLAQSAMTKATGIEAHWGITVTAGNKISGISLLNNGSTSAFAILADHFIVSDGTHDTAPFEIVGGVTKIKNASVGDIHSDNWNATTGTTGWSITKAGNAVFNNVTVRGHVEATSGSFTGAVNATSFIGVGGSAVAFLNSQHAQDIPANNTWVDIYQLDTSGSYWASLDNNLLITFFGMVPVPVYGNCAINLSARFANGQSVSGQPLTTHVIGGTGSAYYCHFSTAVTVANLKAGGHLYIRVQNMTGQTIAPPAGHIGDFRSACPSTLYMNISVLRH